jgi:hypothetical protein
MYTVDFPTRSQNGHSSAKENIFMDKYRMQSYETFPLSNALFDAEAQCIELNKYFPETKVKNSKQKNKCEVRLIVNETVSFLKEQKFQNPGKMFYLLKT